MKLRIFLKNGSVIELALAPPFEFTAFCVNARANGFVMSNVCHIPYDFISMFAYGDEGVTVTHNQPQGMMQ